MPVHDLGYRGWSGERLAPLARWSAIVTTGVHLSGQSKIGRRLLVVAWIPVLYVAGILVVIEWRTMQQGASAAVTVLPLLTDGPAELARLSALAVSDPAGFRGALPER